MAHSLYLLDGHAQIYRAYYAVMGLTSPTGEPTNATFGFATMLLKLLATRKPSHLVMAMDLPGPVFRSEIDVNYKAQRKPMPDDMPPQIERIRQIVETLGLPIIQEPGFEADDLIATLVRRLRTEASENRIYICSKDKDLEQLLDSQVLLYDVQSGEEMDAAGLVVRKGFTPAQVLDILNLTGDTSDNIPGIPGVGPKTAIKWIQQYGSLEVLQSRAGELTGKIGQVFRENIHLLAKGRELLSLRYDVPLAFSWEAAEVHPARLAGLAPIFRELGFTRLLGQLQELGGSNRVAAPVGLFGEPLSPATPAATNLRSEASSTPGAAATPESSPPIFVGLQPVVGDYRLVNTPETMAAMLADLRATLAAEAAANRPAWLAVDTETDALGAMTSNLCGVSLAAQEGVAYYIPVRGIGDYLPAEIVRESLREILEDPSIRKVGQNIKYDLNALRKFGLNLAGLDLDTMVASYLLDASRMSHSMDAMAGDFLGLAPIPITDLIGKGSKQVSFADVPLSRACGYAAEDADVTLRLARYLGPKILEKGLEKLLYELEMPLVRVLAEMEYQGVRLDTRLLKSMSTGLIGRLDELATQIRQAAGCDFNFDSPKQLGEVLFGRLALPVVKKTKTGPSTDIDVLESLASQHPVPALILEYRQLTKLKNTYLDALVAQAHPTTGKVHAHFNQTVAATGRLSSSDPNLQNIPIRTELGRQIRSAFIPSQDQSVILSADYSQIELRILAHYSGDAALLAAFSANRDVHRFVAAEIHGVSEEEVTSEMRSVAKTVNFGIVYGQTGFGLAQVLKIPQAQANIFITAYKARFPGIEAFTAQCVAQAQDLGYVQTILGRRRPIPELQSAQQARRAFGQRAALNSVIQGSAADLIKLAMVRIARRSAAEMPDLKMLMQIHDELVFEVPAAQVEAAAALVRSEMESAMSLNVALKVDLGWGANWRDA